MSIFSDNAQVLMAVGIFLAAADLLLFGFASFILTLLGLAVFSTGVLLYVGLLPEGYASIVLAIAVLTALSGAVLWRPLKRLQEKKQINKVSSDLTGISFVLEQDISPQSPGSYHYSGIDWQVETNEVITAGTEVEVITLEVGVMTVKTAQ